MSIWWNEKSKKMQYTIRLREAFNEEDWIEICNKILGSDNTFGKTSWDILVLYQPNMWLDYRTDTQAHGALKAALLRYKTEYLLYKEFVKYKIDDFFTQTGTTTNQGTTTSDTGAVTTSTTKTDSEEHEYSGDQDLMDEDFKWKNNKYFAGGDNQTTDNSSSLVQSTDGTTNVSGTTTADVKKFDVDDFFKLIEKSVDPDGWLLEKVIRFMISPFIPDDEFKEWEGDFNGIK